MVANRGALRPTLLIGAALTALLPGGAAVAQATAEGTATGVMLEEIVVTARRRAENLQDVPIAVTAFTADTLEQQGAPDITALQRSTPNVTFQVARGSNSTLTAFIRGIGQQDPLWGFEPGVGLYVDDVYIARPQGAVLDIYDIDRIEVLRGPQGTLYGRNTIGGAIKYVTRRLGDEPSLKARAEVGFDNERNAVASGTLPLTDNLSVGAAIAQYSRDGYGKNIVTGTEHYDKDVLAGRLSVELAPGETLFLRLSADRLVDKSNANHGRREVLEPNSQAPVLPGRYDTRAGLGSDNKVVTQGLSLSGEWEATDTLMVKSVTAYRDGYTSGAGIDFDGLPQPYLDIVAGGKVYEDRQFSQELQAQVNTERLQGVFGAYYMDARASGQFDTVLGRGLVANPAIPIPNPTAGTGLTQLTSGSVDTSSFALFGDASYDLTERLKLSAGARWTKDRKDAVVFKANYFGTLGSPLIKPYVPILPPPFNVPQILTNYANDRSFSEFTPRVSASFAASDDVNLYAAYSRGFKSGGFDMRGDATATPDTVQGYDPEIVDSYELGMKGDFAEDRLRINASIFYTDYSGQQVTTQVPNLTNTGVVSFVDNVGDSRIKGAEIEATAVLASDLVANLSLGYIDARFKEFLIFDLASRTYVDVADLRRFQNTPKWNGNLSLTYTRDLREGGSLVFVPAISFRSPVNLFETPVPAIDQGANQLVDVGVTWMSADETYRVGLYGRNLTDARYRTGGYNFPSIGFGQSVIGFYGPPRTFKLTAEVRF